MTRREAIQKVAWIAATTAVVPRAIAQGTAAAASPGPFTLPPLPYAFDALEPYIDARTMEIHHDRHHAGYVLKLNAAVEATPVLAGRSLEDLLANLDRVPDSARTAVRNNGGGDYNHTLFWQVMKKNGGGAPQGELAKAVDKHFGSFSQFQDQFTKAALTQFGSGWAWLVVTGDQLQIQSTPNQDSPLSTGNTPILGVDVWEHAYYLKYQNKRADYVAAWFNVINWDFVSDRYARLKA